MSPCAAEESLLAGPNLHKAERSPESSRAGRLRLQAAPDQEVRGEAQESAFQTTGPSGFNSKKKFENF